MHVAARYVFTLALLLLSGVAASQTDPLPSWKDGVVKARIRAFVQAVTQPGGKHYVAPADRIAVFDNNGTLWSEQPIYFQLAFAIDRSKAMVTENPELAGNSVLNAGASNDMKALAASGEKGLLALLALTHAANTTEEFATTLPSATRTGTFRCWSGQRWDRELGSA